MISDTVRGSRLALLIVVVLSLASPVAAGTAGSDHYQITRDVIASGGGTAVGDLYSNASTTGQPGGIGIQNSSDYQNHGGFWHGGYSPVVLPALSLLSLLILFGYFTFVTHQRRYEARK
ncbi:hypothetical protein JW905_00815 [bacterium]|nr:hypothetical protein [candidate division CSSED10-310 bacterium]